MAANRRGKTQARRSGGNASSGLPGWAWLVLGVALTLVAVLLAPRLLKHEGDGFFRPTPNPDAQPKPVSDEAVVDDETVANADPGAGPKPAVPAGKDAKPRNFDFYTLLPGKETPLSDAELAAREKAEKQVPHEPAPKPADPGVASPASAGTPAPAATGASTANREPANATADAPPSTRPLPKPVDEAAPQAGATHAASSTTHAAEASPPAASQPRYLLQAGAFAGAEQADELKAKIALLGLGARVEPAQIGGKTVYRVRMGPYGTATDLADAKRKLASGGLSGMAVKVN